MMFDSIFQHKAHGRGGGKTESDKALFSACVCLSVEMMGHPELQSECNINQLEPLLPQDVVDDLLSKYVQTFTVRTHTNNVLSN